MAVTDGKITFPASIGEVAELLGEDTRDLGRLCVSEHINKFSRAKPLNIVGFRAITVADQRRANNGLSIPHFSSLADLRTAVLAGAVEWTYANPSGHYRLTDFDRYNHSAQEWALDAAGCSMFNGYVMIGSDDGNIYSGTSISFTLEYEDPDGSYTPLLYPSDWDETSRDNLRAYRLGLALISRATSEVWFRGHSGTLAENFTGLSAIVPSSVANNTTWIIVPLLTNRDTGAFTNSEATAYYIPLEGTYLSAYKYAEDPNALLLYSGEGVALEAEIELTVTLRNNTLSAITVSDLYMVISSEAAYDSSWGIVEVAASTWLTENKLASILPAPGGAILDGSDKVCQRFYKLIDALRAQVGSTTVPAFSSVQFTFSIPALGDDYGRYDDYTYTAFLTNDTKSGYDVTEFEVSITDKTASCFANGYWDNLSPWTNDLGWKNNL